MKGHTARQSWDKARSRTQGSRHPPPPPSLSASRRRGTNSTVPEPGRPPVGVGWGGRHLGDVAVSGKSRQELLGI